MQDSVDCLVYYNPPAQELGLPTWVPNWRDPSIRHLLVPYAKQKSAIGLPDLHLKRTYSLSADVTSQKRRISFAIPQRPKFVPEGFCIGNVAITRPLHYQDAIDNSESNHSRERETENLQVDYGLTGEIILEAVSRTIAADVAKKGLPRE